MQLELWAQGVQLCKEHSKTFTGWGQKPVLNLECDQRSAISR